jgi:hypothetical protein
LYSTVDETAILGSEIDNADFEGYRKEGRVERGNSIISLLRINLYRCCDSVFSLSLFRNGDWDDKQCFSIYTSLKPVSGRYQSLNLSLSQASG